MSRLTQKSIFGFLICAIATFTTVSSQCCDFDVVNCDWNTVIWSFSGVSQPNLVPYPYFTETQPSSTYIWLQNVSGAAQTNSPFYVSSEEYIISFDFFFDSFNSVTSNNFDLYFINVATQIKTLIYSTNIEYNYWRHVEVRCDASVSFCCGSITKVPCEGQLSIVGAMDPSNTQVLFAVDNIGQCSSQTTTTTTPRPTLPPPNPAGCCHFDTDVCGVTSSNWYWSSATLPRGTVPTYSGYYLWTPVDGATAYSSVEYAVLPTTTFSMAYYIDSSQSYLRVYFQEQGSSSRNLMLTLEKNSTDWSIARFSCDNCCGGRTCNGQIILEADGVSEDHVVAVDDVDINGYCNGALPCCYFNDKFKCEFTNVTDGDFSWNWSGLSTPINSLPYTTSSYIYFETVNYNGNNALNPTLRSPKITVNRTTEFVAHLYVYTPLGETGGSNLGLQFHDIASDVSTQMDYAKDTYGQWVSAHFYCDSIHGDCCQGKSTCDGYIEIVANVEAFAGTVVYAVDAIEVGNTCIPFPGLNSKLGF